MGSYPDVEDVRLRETCFVLGGGPSLTQSDVDKLRGRNVIAVNGAGYLAPWAPVLFFNDSMWMRKNRALIEGWQGLVLTTPKEPRDMPRNVKQVKVETRPDFPVVRCGVIRNGKSTGQKAIGLAVAFGAKVVVLLGFDMRLVDVAGKLRSHFHDDYIREASLYRDIFVPAFEGWNKTAQAVGVEIVNATPESALKEFPFKPLDEILGVT